MIRESRLYINVILLYITYVPWYNHDHGHDHDTSNQCSVKGKTGTMIFPWLYHDFPSVTWEMLTPNNKCFPSTGGIVVMTVYLYAHLDVVIITSGVWAHKNANTIMQSLQNTRVSRLFWNTRDHFSMGSAIERRRYNVTSSLIGSAHSQNDPRGMNGRTQASYQLWVILVIYCCCCCCCCCWWWWWWWLRCCCCCFCCHWWWWRQRRQWWLR